MIDKHEILAEYQDERITITGVFERFSFITQNYREVKTALLQDVYAHVDGKDLDIGHVWLQNAESLKALDFAPGERIRCNCRVKTHGLMVENKFSLAWPTEVEVISRLQSPQLQNNVPSVKSVEIIVPSLIVSKESVESMTPAKIISEVRRVAKLSGGWDALQELVEAIRAEA